MSSNPVNIKQLAQRLGVSPTTISRALSGQGRISAATRERILAQAQELGYTPNLNAQRLVHGRAYTVALKSDGKGNQLFDTFSTELIRSIQYPLQARSYGLLLDPGGEAFPRWVKAQAVDGVIVLGGSPEDGAMAQEIAQTGVPCVVIGHMPLVGIPGVGSIVIDLESGGRQTAQMLAERGHRRIGFIGSYSPNQLLTAFEAGLQERGIVLDPARVRIPGPTPEGGAQAMRELLSLPEPPTAVFTRTDVLAVSALQAAWEMGFQVPRDVSIIGHDDVSFVSWTTPALTTVRVDTARVGQLATEMLFTLLAFPNEPIPAQVVPTQLITRASVGNAPTH